MRWPKGGRLLQIEKAIPASCRRPAAAIVAGVKVFWVVTRVPSTSETTSEIFLMPCPRGQFLGGGTNTSTPVAEASTTIELRPTNNPFSTVPTVAAIRVSSAPGLAIGPNRQSRIK